MEGRFDSKIPVRLKVNAVRGPFVPGCVHTDGTVFGLSESSFLVSGVVPFLKVLIDLGWFPFQNRRLMNVERSNERKT